MQYKIGAKVKVTAKDAAYFDKVGEVVACADLSKPALYKVKFDCADDVMIGDNDGVWYCESRLAPATISEFKQSRTLFRIGDKVFINAKCTAYKDLVGKHGVVADVVEGRCKVEFGANDYVWITDEVLSADDVVQFKIGDPVIVSGNVPYYSGCKGKVVDIYGSIRTIVVELVKNGEYCSRTFLADELALDNAELRRVDEKMMKHFGHVRWEVGDKVIIHSYDCNGYCFGKHGTIEEATPLGNYRVKIEETGSYGWFAGSDLSRDIRGVEPRKRGSDVWHVNVAELAGRTISGCKGLAFGEE